MTIENGKLTIEPTLIFNEFKIVEWNTTFLISNPQTLKVEDARAILGNYVKMQFEIFLGQRIKHKKLEII